MLTARGAAPLQISWGQNTWKWKPGVCKCSGHSNGGPLLPNLEVVDLLQVPRDLAPGKYVLQWRWDCEVSPLSRRVSDRPCGALWSLAHSPSLLFFFFLLHSRRPIRSGPVVPTSRSPRDLVPPSAAVAGSTPDQPVFFFIRELPLPIKTAPVFLPFCGQP